MGKMSPDLLQLIKETLKKCDDVFLENRCLYRFFSDSRLSIWQELLPEASNFSSRIEGTIHYLYSKENNQGRNALVIFLQVLSERYPVADERHSLLLNIVNQLQPVSLLPHEEEQSDVLIEANPMQEPIRAVSEIEHIGRCARSIALIEVTRYRKKKNEYTETGTGWLIAPGLVLTCWHVVAALAFAGEPPPTATELQTQIEHMLLSFNHLEIGKGGIQYNVSRLEYPSTEIDRQDFALIRLKDRSDKPYWWLDYLPIELDAPFTQRTQLSIIQHPLGQTQQLSSGYFINDSRITGRVLYNTPTEIGTSGAPVLNRYNWRVVALHNGENRKVQLREGTRIKHILSELQVKKPDLYDEIMEAQRARDTSLPPIHLTHPLNPYLHHSETILHASFSPVASTEQETASSSTSKNTASPTRSDQQYDYVYSSTYNSPSAVSCLAFHPTGQYLISGDSTGTIKVWDMSAKSLEDTLKTYTNATPSLAFSPDGHYLASSSDDGTITLWNFLKRTREKTLQGHTDWVSCLVFSLDGQYLVSGSDDGSIKMREVLHGMAAHQLLKEPTGVFSIALNPHNQLFASCASGQNVKLWSISRQKIPSLLEPLTGIRSLIFSPDGHYFVAGSETGSLAIYETITWKIVHLLTRHTSKIRCLAFHPDGTLLASGGDDQVIQLWDVLNGKNIQTLVKHTSRIESLAFSPDGQYIASGGRDASILLWQRV